MIPNISSGESPSDIWPSATAYLNRGQRIAQLVGEHRQKLVLLPVRFLHRVKQPGIIHSNGDPLCQVLRKRNLALPIAAVRIAGHQPDDADRLIANFQRNADHGLRAEHVHHLAMLFALREAAEKRLRQLVHQLWSSRCAAPERSPCSNSNRAETCSASAQAALPSAIRDGRGHGSRWRHAHRSRTPRTNRPEREPATGPLVARRSADRRVPPGSCSRRPGNSTLPLLAGAPRSSRGVARLPWSPAQSPAARRVWQHEIFRPANRSRSRRPRRPQARTGIPEFDLERTDRLENGISEHQRTENRRVESWPETTPPREHKHDWKERDERHAVAEHGRQQPAAPQATSTPRMLQRTRPRDLVFAAYQAPLALGSEHAPSEIIAIRPDSGNRPVVRAVELRKAS